MQRSPFWRKSSKHCPPRSLRRSKVRENARIACVGTPTTGCSEALADLANYQEISLPTLSSREWKMVQMAWYTVQEDYLRWRGLERSQKKELQALWSRQYSKIPRVVGAETGHAGYSRILRRWCSASPRTKDRQSYYYLIRSWPSTDRVSIP